MIESLENVFEITDDEQQRLQMSKGREALQAGLSSLSQKYAVLRGARDKQKSGIDYYVYGTYTKMDCNDGFDNKHFDVDDADNIIIDGV